MNATGAGTVENGADVRPAAALPEGVVVAPWPRTVEVLSRLVASRVSSTVQILRGQVRAFDENFPEWQYLPHSRVAWVDQVAVLLALHLISGRCGCGHHVRKCLSASAGCRCCVRGHALHAWDPDAVPLGVFVANAVRGIADTRSRSGVPSRVVRGDAFSRSMLRPVLDRAGLEPLVVAEVEFRRCALCAHRFERTTGADLCPACFRPDDEGSNRREVMRHVLLYPDAGGYQRVRRVLCRACGGYFDTRLVDAGKGCPLRRCLSKRQLRCPTRGCAEWREIDDLTTRCVGCGEWFAVRCPECHAPRTVGDVLRCSGNCRCGHELVDALNQRKLALCRTREVWVR